VDSVAVFPFGSTISKTVNFFQIDNILSEHGHHNKSVLVYVHISDIHRIEKTDRYKVVILKNLSEIIDVVKKAEVVISVDTFQLHLAELYNKKIIIAGHINKKFIPNSIEY
jgi:ADP-heptose:LPS heptosyltransferase